MYHMQDFYEDLFEELSKYGELESLNVCDNLADHMVCFIFISLLKPRSEIQQISNNCLPMLSFLLYEQVGNVYVQYREEEHAAEALRNLSGRFYAGLFSRHLLAETSFLFRCNALSSCFALGFHGVEPFPLL